MPGNVWKIGGSAGMVENTTICGHGPKNLVLQGHHVQAPVTHEVGAREAEPNR